MVGTIDLVVIALYFVFILIVGMISYRKVNNETDYSLAGRSLGYPTLIGAITATAIGSGATLGVGGLSYNFGIVVIWSIIAYALGLLGFSVIAGVIRRIKYWTIPEVLLARYGNTARIISAVFLLLGLIALFGVQVAALGTVFTAVGGTLWGVTYSQAVLVARAVMIAYTFAGGMFALAYTEIVQAVLLLVILGVLLPVFLFMGIDIGRVTATLPSHMFDFFHGIPFYTLIGWFLTLIPICFIDVSLWQRASSARDEHVAKRSILVSTLLYFGYSLSIILVGIIGFYLYPSLKEIYGTNDVVVPILIINNLPPVMIGLSIAAILAVLMSTAASVLMVAGMTVSRDVARLIKPDLKEKTALWTARIAVVAIGALGITFSLLMRGIFEMMLLSFAIFIAVAFVPTMAALFWKKATNTGAIASMIGGGITVVALYGLKFTVGLPEWVEPIAGALIVAVILMYVLSILTYKPGVTPQELSKT
ncbi:MAG: sodium:solute symporter family protein [Deltaproteobacteria bacterium]|nr:sodium:solute symporter family protein [Candidatus Zymogenaceae bacterium]